MTGFIRGLFGGNKEPRAPKPPRNTGAYFLSEDEAKTFGDIDYMRSSKVIKRTYARKKGQTEELESIRSISALGKEELNEYGIPTRIAKIAESISTPASPNTPKTNEPSFTPPSRTNSSFTTPNRSVDTSMDMFRNMAKELKKR